MEPYMGVNVKGKRIMKIDSADMLEKHKQKKLEGKGLSYSGSG